MRNIVGHIEGELEPGENYIVELNPGEAITIDEETMGIFGLAENSITFDRVRGGVEDTPHAIISEYKEKMKVNLGGYGRILGSNTRYGTQVRTCLLQSESLRMYSLVVRFERQET